MPNETKTTAPRARTMAGESDPTIDTREEGAARPPGPYATQKLLMANWSPQKVMSACVLHTWGCLGLPTVTLARITTWTATVRQRQPWPSHV